MRLLTVATVLCTVLCIAWNVHGTDVGQERFAVAVVTDVVDGDTFYVRYVEGGDGLPTSIRPYLIDTPEINKRPTECFGPEATFAAWQLLFGKTVWLRHYGRLADDRLLAFVYLDPEGLSLFQATMVAQGLARVDLQHEEEEPFCETMRVIEEQARRLGLGIWSVCDAVPEAPALCQNH